MDAKELRQLSPEELKTKIRQWKEELFRTRFKGQSQEMRDTSIFRKFRRNVARANFVLSELSKKAATTVGNEVSSNG